MPLMGRFTRIVERILPERASPLTRCLDASALLTPIAAVEAVRRTIARALGVVCGSVDASLASARADATVGPGKKNTSSVPEASDALRQAQLFISEVTSPPESEHEKRQLTNTLHALDHACRLAETASNSIEIASSDPEDVRAAQLCVEAMRRTASIAAEVATLPTAHLIEIRRDTPGPLGARATPDPNAKLTDEDLVELERCVKALGELRTTHRIATLSAVAKSALTADQAIVRVDSVRNLETLANHAWRSSAHLVGRGNTSP
jgi:phosphate:Na+ symporter